MRYNSCSDGAAIKIRISAGNTVQATSIICPSSMYRLISLFMARRIIIYITTVRIIRIIINAWSWNEISCSIIGDALSWVFIFAHVVISKKSLLTLYVELKSTALICQNRLFNLIGYLITMMVGNSE
jgi:hypothetical protein